MHQAVRDFIDHPIHEIQLYLQYSYYKAMRLLRFVVYWKKLQTIKTIVKKMPPPLYEVLSDRAKFAMDEPYEVDYSIVNKLVIFIQGTKEVVLEWSHLTEYDK